MGTRIIGCGKALPQLEVTNDDLAAYVDTTDEWIFSRTGIRSRHIAVGESTLDLACEAARRALGETTSEGNCWIEKATTPKDIDLVICATLSPDTLIPSTAAGVKRILGLEHAVAFDLNAACSGFIYGLSVADAMMSASNLPTPCKKQTMKRALVIGVDRLSRILDWNDRNTCVLFGDGAGAAVVEWDESDSGMLATYLKTVDDVHNSLICQAAYDSDLFFNAEGELAEPPEGIDPSFVSLCEALACEPERLTTSVAMLGQSVFKFASRALCDAIEQVLDASGLSLDDIALIVPHQANERIIKYAAKRLKLDLDRFQVCMAGTGNTSAASIPVALVDAYAEGRIKKGDKVIVVAFGAGLTYGGVLFEA